MAFLVAARREFPEVFVTETHPKILYYALCREPYDYQGSNKTLMNTRLGRWLGVDVAPRNSHEWDAAISALAVVRGRDGSWSSDLHALPADHHGRLIRPCGDTAYMWPE